MGYRSYLSSILLRVKKRSFFSFFFKQNSATEKSQRFGSASVPGSGRLDHFDIKSVQEKAKLIDQSVKEEFKVKNPTRGYGGKYGTEQVMDKVTY